MNFARVSGITLHYAREGVADGIPLVFINSLGTDLRIWDRVVPRFTNRYALIRYDKRGHGLSDCPPAPYSIRDHAHDLVGLLDRLEVQKAILVGISVGGMIAQDFAATWPERVKALVLCDTRPKIGTADAWNERIDALRQHGMDHLADAILARWFMPSFIEESPEAYRGYYNMLTRTPLEGYTGTCEAIRDADLTNATGMIKVPSLVMCGAQDISTPPELARELADQLVNSRFEIIQGAAHLSCIEQSAAVAAGIDRFLQDNGYV
jgi:3-oxoadipate enol-lactonase